MKPDHVAFRVINEGDKAVLSDGLFWLLNSSAVLNRAGRFDRAVTAGKINDGAAGSRVLALHFDQGAGASWIVRLAQWRERPEFETRTFEAFQRHLEGVLIKCFGSLHVLNIDFEPAYGTALGTHSGCPFFRVGFKYSTSELAVLGHEFRFFSFDFAYDLLEWGSSLLDPESMHLRVLGGEDTKRNLKHAKRLRRNRKHGCEAV